MATITDASTRHHDVIRDLLANTAEDRSHFEALRNT